MAALALSIDPFLLVFIGLAVVFVVLFLAGAFFILFVLPSESKAKRRRRRRERRQERFWGAFFDFLTD